VRAEGSSSPSAKSVQIDSIERGASGVVKITAGGSSFVFKTEYAEKSGFLDALAAGGQSLSGLAAGTGLDEDAMSCLALAAAASEAENRAVALLARAEQCRALLDAKLEKRGLPSQARRLALDSLEEAGYLSDRRFAEAWLHTRDFSAGPAKLLLGLRTKGIDSKTAAAALDAVLDPETRRRALEAAAARELEKAGNDRDSARNRLRALGFHGEEVRSVLYNE